MKDETNKWREAALALLKSNVESCARAEAAEARAKEIFEQLTIATDMADKRWRALNEIYEQAASGNTDWHWRHRKAGEGLGLKEEVEE